jgi:hypothetical protein
VGCAEYWRLFKDGIVVAAKLRRLGRVGVRMPSGGVFWPKEAMMRKQPATETGMQVEGVKPDPPPAPPKAADVAVDVVALLGRAAIRALVESAKETQRAESAARLIAEARLYDAAGVASMRSPAATLREAAEIVSKP